MTCTRISAPGVDVFICGRTRTACHRCAQIARTSCSFDGCARPLCDEHVRKVDGQPRCSQHAPMAVNANMPKPPGRG